MEKYISIFEWECIVSHKLEEFHMTNLKITWRSMDNTLFNSPQESGTTNPYTFPSP